MRVFILLSITAVLVAGCGDGGSSSSDGTAGSAPDFPDRIEVVEAN